MAIIETKSLQDFTDIQTEKWKELIPNIATNSDSMVYLDASVISEVAYLLQNDAIILTNNSFIAYATGDELTNLWIDRGIPRKLSTKATWLATFWRNEVGTTDFTIEVWTLVSTEPSELDWSYLSFETTSQAILYGQISSPLAPTISKTPNVSGRFAVGTYSFAISSFDGSGETPLGNIATTTVSTQSSITIGWSGVSNAVKYWIYYAIWSGSYTKVWETTGISFAVPDTGILPWTAPQTTNTTGYLTVSVPIQATSYGVSSNVAVNTITNFVNKPIGIDYVINDNTETAGGTDDEWDDDYKIRIRDSLSNNTGKVTVDWYRQTALSVPWVANAQVQVVWSGAYRNNIWVTITSNTGNGVPSSILISTVRSVLNSDINRAVCDNITVTAPTTLAINVSAHITEYDTSYTTSYLTSAITTALNEFFPKVTVWWKVYVVEIANTIHDVTGIIDFTISSPTVNTQLASGQMAVSGAITITF